LARGAGRGGRALKLSAILVHYQTPALAERAVAALDEDASASGLELEILLVDNGCDAGERRRLEALPARYLDAGGNRGYAGGANLGIAAATGDALLVMNPDVLVLPGCLARLAAELEGGAAAAGPRFFWDEKRTFLLPPAEERSFAAELLAVLARRGGGWARRGRRRWRRHARRHWLAPRPLPSHALSGALLALRRDAVERIGAFDESYRLYFEETDWLWRLRRRGLEARYVPAAEAVHLYARSTAGEPRARAWFEDSARRFRRRAYGALGNRLLEALSRRLPPVEAQRNPPSSPPRPRASGDLWLEVAGSPTGYPAAGHRLSPTAAANPDHLLPAIAARLPAGRYLLRLVAGEREIVEWAIGLDQKRSPSPLA